MALNKLIQLENGTSTAYHRIKFCSRDYTEDIVHIIVTSYYNDEYREKERLTENGMVLNVLTYDLPAIDDDFSRANLYLRLKTEIPEFQDAVDC